MLKFMVIVVVIHWFEIWWRFGVVPAEVLAGVLVGREKKSQRGFGGMVVFLEKRIGSETRKKEKRGGSTSVVSLWW